MRFLAIQARSFFSSSRITTPIPDAKTLLPPRFRLSSHSLPSLHNFSKTTCSYGREPGNRQRGRPSGRQNTPLDSRRPPPNPRDIQIVIREYAVPAAGVLILATVLGPIIGAVAFSAFALAMGIAAVGAAFTLSWVLIPVLLTFMGVPLLFSKSIGLGILSGMFGVMLFPTLLQIGLISAAVYLGWTVAGALWGSPNGSDAVDDDVVDVDIDTIDNLEDEIEIEMRQREQELRDFDELLRRRERNG